MVEHSKHTTIVSHVLVYAHTVTGGGDSKAGPTLAPGDIVEVSEGQLMHLQGKVINVEGDVITIMPKHEDLKVLHHVHTLYNMCVCISESIGYVVVHMYACM